MSACAVSNDDTVVATCIGAVIVHDCVSLSSLCRLKHAQDMVVNLEFEKERLGRLVHEEADQMKRLNDILRIVEM